ncbi:MAG: T9SS type A sorting domain-containing protein, partial [Flavobacteriales bacterium]
PNPSKGLFNIQFTNNTIQKLNIRILNSIGQVIFEDIQNGFIGNYKNTVNFSSFSKSIYFLEIQTDQGKINKKLILN